MVDSKISLAIPAYNSSKFIKTAITLPLGDDRIDEIVIVDDLSGDYNKIAYLKEIEKIKFYRNERNLGGFLNKFEAVSKCKNDWVILLDSDNWLLEEYLDKIYESKWEEDVILCPASGMKKMDFAFIAGFYIDRNNIKELYKRYSLLIAKFLNTGNYFFNRESYLEIESSGQPQHTPCAITFNDLWLKKGNKFFIVPGMNYAHRTNGGNYWKNNQETMQPIVDKILKSL